ncbi:Os04g0641350, partial [Oryza sativa Japonica Group]
SAAADRASDKAILVAIGASPELAGVDIVVDEYLAAAVARLARDEPDVAACGARLHVPELAHRRGLAPFQHARELGRLVQRVDVLGAAEVAPVDEHPRERGAREAAGAEELRELGPEDGVHGHVALVQAHAVAAQDAAHGAAVDERLADAAEAGEVDDRLLVASRRPQVRHLRVAGALARPPLYLFLERVDAGADNA